MRIICPRCQYALEYDEDDTLGDFRCPSCSHEFGLLPSFEDVSEDSVILDVDELTKTHPSIDDGPLDFDPNESLAPSVFHTMAQAIRDRTFEGKEIPSSGVVHHYRILSKLGQGGMGTVFSAEHVYLRRKVALKTLRSATSNTASERFLLEAQVLALLDGPNVLSVQDAFVHDGLPYFVTELLEGMTLDRYIKETGKLTLNRTLDLLEEIAQVLIRHESLGVVHRDIKPSNIWVKSNGEFCLFDYGLVGYVEKAPSGHSAPDESRQIMGTPVYMAPEQALDPSRVDRRTDLFGLGATAWQALTGVSPRGRKGETFLSLIESIGHTPLRAVSEFCESVPPQFERVLDSLVALDPDDRYSSASEFLEDLERYRYGRLRPYGATKGSAFIAIPFSQHFDSLFGFLEEVCGEVKLAARRVDRAPKMIDIWSQIQSEIEQATVVIAVFTRRRFQSMPNANVITEAAHARAIGKPLIILTTDCAESLPFDWRHLPLIRYKNTRRGYRQLKEDLIPRLRRELR